MDVLIANVGTFTSSNLVIRVVVPTVAAPCPGSGVSDTSKVNVAVCSVPFSKILPINSVTLSVPAISNDLERAVADEVALIRYSCSCTPRIPLLEVPCASLKFPRRKTTNIIDNINDAITTAVIFNILLMVLIVYLDQDLKKTRIRVFGGAQSSCGTSRAFKDPDAPATGY